MKRAELLASLDIGSTIKRLRESKGMSQEALAKGICDRTNLTKLENGHSKSPSFSFVLLLCDRLEISIEEFLNECFSNFYTLKRNMILHFLLNNEIDKLEEYLKSITENMLSIKDREYYKYLMLKVLLNKNNINSNIIEELLKSESVLIKYLTLVSLIGMKNLKTYKLEEILNVKFIETINDSNAPLEYLYVINTIIKCSGDSKITNYLLNKELEFINNHQCYDFLIYYFENKANLYNDKDSLLISNTLKESNTIDKKNTK